MTADPAIVADLAPTGSLRAAINLGNSVMCQGTADEPSGLTVDLARELACRLGVPARLHGTRAARDSFAALMGGAVDIAFLAHEPARAAEVAFIPPYAAIEAAYVVPAAGRLATAAEVDRPGVRVGVKAGSAYDLFLTRTLRQAEVVRGAEGVDVFRDQGLEVGAGIRGPVMEFAARHPGLRVLDEAFMQIRQSIASRRDRMPQTLAWLAQTMAELVRDGFVADALARSGQAGAVTILEPRPADAAPGCGASPE